MLEIDCSRWNQHKIRHSIQHSLAESGFTSSTLSPTIVNFGWNQKCPWGRRRAAYGGRNGALRPPIRATSWATNAMVRSRQAVMAGAGIGSHPRLLRTASPEERWCGLSVVFRDGSTKKGRFPSQGKRPTRSAERGSKALETSVLLDNGVAWNAHRQLRPDDDEYGGRMHHSD